MEDTIIVWLGYDEFHNMYRTNRGDSSLKEWTSEPENAQVFGNENHALNSARYYSKNEAAKSSAKALRVEVLASDIKDFFSSKSRIKKGVFLSQCKSGWKIDK